MQNKQVLDIFIESSRVGTFFTLPFTMPADVESLTIRYSYERFHDGEPAGGFTPRIEINIIDIGLISPSGYQVGASGSNKTEIHIDSTSATPGYHIVPLTPGKWQILIGAYKIAPEGAKVTYELTFAPKQLRMLKGDLHTHTFGSDGVLGAEELARHALRHGLDFLAITDHNQFAATDAFPHVPGVTLIPGVEWTHYQGHANFLGVDRPYAGLFATNTPDEAAARFASARENGALIVLNHPFDEGAPFKFNFNVLPFDCLEIWNGPMRESNLRALGLWHSLLSAGKKIPIVGGSDYHRDNLFQILGGPTTCVFSMSTSPADILPALKAGHAYLTFAPIGPTLEFSAGGVLLGDSVRWADVKEMHIKVDGLITGDRINLVTRDASESLITASSTGSFDAVIPMPAPGFARVEVHRVFIPGVPPLPALISNPIYFDA